MLRIADEVASALEQGRPVVALESSIVAHGLPYPANLETALESEAVVRETGAQPATIAVLNGTACIGLSAAELETLAAPEARHPKASSADLAYHLARGHTAGTTVSATSLLASRAGIRVFATGGIGGVHRGDSGDVSADLRSLAETPIAVVSAGPKAILDLPRTVEMLETLGVLTIGFRTSELPAFYSRQSGIEIEHRADSLAELATITRTRLDVLGQGGLLVANPIDESDEIPAAELEPVIIECEASALSLGIRGKALTPFLLGKLRELVGPRAIECNRALVLSNARLAGGLAGAILPKA